MRNPQASPFIFDTDERHFPEAVIARSANTPILVDFWAEWCAPCIALTPILEKVVLEQAGRVLLAKVDADENMRLCGHYRLRGFPTVVLFRDGVERGRFHGARPVHRVQEFIEEHR